MGFSWKSFLESKQAYHLGLVHWVRHMSLINSWSSHGLTRQAWAFSHPGNVAVTCRSSYHLLLFSLFKNGMTCQLPSYKCSFNHSYKAWHQSNMLTCTQLIQNLNWFRLKIYIYIYNLFSYLVTQLTQM
jgi:hypothetical protein